MTRWEAARMALGLALFVVWAPLFWLGVQGLRLILTDAEWRTFLAGLPCGRAGGCE